jgi:cell division protein FtsQ
MSWIPFTEETLHRVFLAVILGGAVVLAWVVASLAGVPAMAQAQLATLASGAGFEVRRVDVRGVKHLNELKVYERVLAEKDQAMPLVDIHALRAELLQLSWVQDARVSRQLPDTLVVDIVERTPHAVLRKADKLVLIDATGHELETVTAARAKGKLVLSGLGAGKQVEGLGALLEAAPALKPQVREAEWVGNRRWNLTFRPGQVLALPEGAKPSATALMSFARLDGANRLLGGRVAAFDMRAADRIYLRVPGRAADEATAKAAAAIKPAAEKPKAEAPPAAKREEDN